MAGANAKQLRDNLANYDAQLDQVEAALTNDPDNTELSKLKEDLSEVKQLTLDLLELAPEPQKRKERTGTTLDWKPGELCRAIWADNGKYYNATIDMIAADGETCTLTFDGYGTTVIVKLSDLRPHGWEEEEEAKMGAGAKRKKTDARANAKEKRAEIREMKKRKAQKKKERLQEIETFRENEKSRWQSFSQKSSKSKGAIDGRQKKSIFAVPDSLAGRVGVGTCNIGGKGMTDFSIPSKTTASRQQ